MHQDIAGRPGIGWQRRRSDVQFYFCCCPLMLPLAPLLLFARLAQYGALRLLGHAPPSPWARRG